MSYFTFSCLYIFSLKYFKHHNTISNSENPDKSESMSPQTNVFQLVHSVSRRFAPRNEQLSQYIYCKPCQSTHAVLYFILVAD